MLRNIIFCRYLWFRSGAPSAKRHDLITLFVEVVPQSSEVRFVVVHCGFGGCPSAKKYDLLSMFVVSKWCLIAKKYDLLPLFVGSK